MTTQKKESIFTIITHFWDPAWLRTWAMPYHKETGWRAFGVRQLEVFVLTARSLYQEEITLRAAALTYRTLLSIVPIMAVAFALFKAFGGLKKMEGPLRSLILENLAVGRGNEVGQWLDGVIQNINAGAIAGVGVLVLFYSAVGLLTNIEGSINRIFGIRTGRPLVTRFFIYWGLITLSPPLIGFSVSISAQLQSSAFATWVVQWLPLGLGRLLVWFSSALSTCIAFVLCYQIVPNTRVRLKAALLGGIVAGMMWNLSKAIFIATTAGSLKYSAVYGALGVLPLLMLWIYISWLIVLFGATYTYANQSIHTEGFEVASLRMSQGFREMIAARLMVCVARAFRKGEPPLSAEELAARAGAMTSLANRVIHILVRHDVLVETRGDQDKIGYLPGKSLQELTMDQVMEAMRWKEGTTIALTDDPSMPRLARVMEEAEEATRRVLARADMRSLASEEPFSEEEEAPESLDEITEEVSADGADGADDPEEKEEKDSARTS